MLSLQANPGSNSLRQCVEATSREARDEGSVLDSAQDSEEESDVKGQVEYYAGYCLDKFPMTYKTEVLYLYCPQLVGVSASIWWGCVVDDVTMEIASLLRCRVSRKEMSRCHWYSVEMSE